MNAAEPATYDPSALSEEEKKRFLAALHDGFGNSPRKEHLEEAALPAEINPGLSEHRAYFNKNYRSEYIYEDEEESEFWEESDGDSPPGLFEQCPVNFHFPSIREYFDEQRLAYLKYVKSSDDYSWLDDLKPEERDEWDERIYDEVLYEPYSKAWYEYHINLQFYFVDENLLMLNQHVKSGLNIALSVLSILTSSATLGRLVEQYYWKFLLEKSAILGSKVYKSAKTGGIALALIRKKEQKRWQAMARLIWQEDPTRSKTTVASILKKRLKINRSVKHLARFLIRP